MKHKIKNRDYVIVIKGKDKGKVSVVKEIFKNGVVLLYNLNIKKKHFKIYNDKKKYGIIPKENFINISNIAIFNPYTNKADKVKFKFVLGKKKRFFKSNGLYII
ncbi:50S ribosomal protein L24 [Candidatus Annandia adelgestsuga]|uniref:Large ribosomal subunit protein uL24 n=1 Tax=Candidatus Annandia adelgestsuga TaxID=1302411 RepID=A0A3Q9CKP7_9ENTR|nr:50S ribosomal protein L24 [Candidatus Annandia adelgestsuga]AZP36211.1 50S ribosomal protein L24 [Candidatus Annandia adelgestsuga]